MVGQDIDPVAAKMTLIQLSVLGCRVVIKIGDSLADPILAHDERNCLHSPAYRSALKNKF